MRIDLDAQRFEQEKEGWIWWAIAMDHVRNLEDLIFDVLRGAK